MKKLLVPSSLVLLLSACSQPVEKMDSDYSVFLPMSPLSAQFYGDLNQHPGSTLLEEATGLIMDYDSPVVGEESMTFLFRTVTGETGHIMRINLQEEYPGGVDQAIEDGFIHDLTPLLEEHAPHFMERIAEDEEYQKSAYSDGGHIVYFGATMVDQELRGLPYYGPLVNEAYLEQVGLAVPKTIADWEEMLAAFHNLGVKPFSFGGEEGFAQLYDCFASAYGVTMGNFYFQEDGVVRFSPFEDGFYDYLELLHRWYSNGWIEAGFFSKSTTTNTVPDLLSGKVASSVGHISTIAQNTDLTPAPYPVLEEGDSVHSRHYTPDFADSPSFLHSQVTDPVPLIQWLDFFYSEEGIALSNWGLEGDTYMVNDQGEKEFTEKITNDSKYSPLYMLSKEVLLEVGTVLEWECQSYFFQEDIQELGWEIWGNALYDQVMPQTYSYTPEENAVVVFEIANMNAYINTMVVSFITGQEPLSNYSEFQESLVSRGAYDFLAIEQAALDRYNAR